MICNVFVIRSADCFEHINNENNTGSQAILINHKLSLVRSYSSTCWTDSQFHHHGFKAHKRMKRLFAAAVIATTRECFIIIHFLPSTWLPDNLFCYCVNYQRYSACLMPERPESKSAKVIILPVLDMPLIY